MLLTGVLGISLNIRPYIHMLMHMQVIDEFLKNKAPNTQKNYTWILNQFFNELNQKPDNYFKLKDHDYKKDIIKWWEQHLNEVPKTRNTKLNIIKSFFEEQEIVFPKKFWVKQRRKRKGSRAATLDRVPTIKEFKSMLNHGTVKDKALFLLAASSGMRIDECLQLKENMIDFNHEPCMITLPGELTKTGDPRITFCSDEAKEYIQEWLKIRDEYLDQAIARTGHIHKKNRNDDTLFPFKYNIAWTRWTYLIKKAGLDKRDPTTNRYLLHIHTLRKFFLSRMKLELKPVIPEALAGHEEYLDSAYKRYTKKELGEQYKKGMPLVTVFSDTPDLTEVTEEMAEIKQDNTMLKQEVFELRSLISNLKSTQIEDIKTNNPDQIETITNAILDRLKNEENKK